MISKTTDMSNFCMNDNCSLRPTAYLLNFHVHFLKKFLIVFFNPLSLFSTFGSSVSISGILDILSFITFTDLQSGQILGYMFTISSLTSYLLKHLLQFTFPISQFKQIQTSLGNFFKSYFSHFEGDTTPITAIDPIPPIGVCRGEMPCLDDKFVVVYSILNTRVITQTLLGFIFYRSLWGESISNDSNDSCRKTPHIITTILNTRR